MLEAMEIVFWETATTVVGSLLVPIISVILIMGLIWSALGLGARK